MPPKAARRLHLGRRLRFLADKMHLDFDPVSASFPEVRDALAELDRAIAEEFPPNGRKRRGAPRMGTDQRIKRLKNQLGYARKLIVSSRQQLQSHTRAKDPLMVLECGDTDRSF